MNPLAAALLAAQGWDVSRLRKQSNDSYARPSNGHNQVDLNSLLNNPAILQALQAQSTNIHEPPPTPEQTTRFGRVSRPPVVEQESLAIIQQILGQGEANQNGQSRTSRQPQQEQRQGQTFVSAPRVNSKRPHSTLRESSIPRSRSPTSMNRSPSPARMDQPLVRPQQPVQGGRPRRGETVSKEERAERRRVQNTLSAADYRKKKEIYMSSLEDRIKVKEDEIKAKAEECEMWRRKFADLEKQHAVMTALWTAAGFDLPNHDGSVQHNDRFMANANMAAPLNPTANRASGVRNLPDVRNPSGISPAALNPIRSPIPLYSANSTPNNYPSPAIQSQHPTPLASASTTLAAAMPSHPTVSPHSAFPESSPVGTADGDGTPFDLGVDLSAFDDFFNWDIQPDNDADDQQDADFIPASSPHRSDSDEETDREGDPSGARKKRRTKNKGKGKKRDDDEEFIDPEVDEEDLFMPITDVEVPPGQMQLVEKAAKDVMSTFGVDSQAQLMGMMQKMVDSGDRLTEEEREKLRSVVRWMRISAGTPRP